MGARSFFTLAGIGALTSGLATGRAVSQDASYSACGGYGISGAFIGYHAFKTPHLFTKLNRFRLFPYAWLALGLYYGLSYNDQGLVGGMAGGYLAFLIGLI